MKTNKFFIPNFRPLVGSTKTVLLTLAERKERERQKLAVYVVDLLMKYPDTMSIRSYNKRYSYCVTNYGFRFKIFSENVLLAQHLYKSCEEFSQHLFYRHNLCELRQFAKNIDKRYRDRCSLAGNIPSQCTIPKVSVPQLSNIF